MICSNCNFENSENARFCGECGAPLEPAPAPPPLLSKHVTQKKATPGWIWGLSGFLIVVILFGSLAFFLLPGFSRASNNPGSPAQSSNPVEVGAQEQRQQDSTPTPQPTKISPTLTNTASISLYDDFNDSSFDGNFDESKWRREDFSIGTATQQYGVLVLSNEGAEGVTFMLAREYEDFKLENPLTIEIKMRIDSTENGGSTQINLGADLPDVKWWVAQCFLNPDGGTCYENVYPEDKTVYTAEWIEAAPGTWHTFRIKLDLETMRITYYFDNRNIGSHVPVTAEAMKNSGFDITPGIWSEGEAPMIGYFDEVRIEQ